jgi:aubergine-like protein
MPKDKVKDILLKRERRVPGFTVITKWGKQLSYQIDDIDFDTNPKNKTFIKEDRATGEKHEVSILDYFAQEYPEVRIREANQPLLVVHKPDQNIYLPPELCFIPNLPDDFTKNTMAMRDIQELKTVNPTKRFERITTLASKLRNNNEIKSGNLEISEEMVRVKGRYLNDLSMKDPKNPQVRHKFDDYTRGSFQHYQPMNLREGEWAIVYTNRDYNMCNDFIAGMRKASGRMGISLGEPEYIELSGNRKDDYITGFKSLQAGTHKIVLVLIFNDRDKHHLKQIVDNKVGIPSQFVLSKTAQKASGALSVAGNILK